MKPVTNATLPTRRRLKIRPSETKKARRTLTRQTTPVSNMRAPHQPAFHALLRHVSLTTCTEDERSIANRLNAAEPQNDSTSGKDLSEEDKAAQQDPTLPARMHGNEPSRGAKIDKEIEDEEAAIIAKKDAAKAASKKKN
jgi:hypothetical protein